ncbi:MAG TPA: thioredoxin-like domain-containing protein [Pyrinomonadaceae bacterium]|nr:thioredoxin-like domain-containing protein [Pyrinomonadaceae bacterium]
MLKVLTGIFFAAIFSINVSAMIYQAKVRAPELAGGKNWLNTEKPLSLAALKGRVVLLDFWTYGCINCIHIIPELKKLEAKYEKNLVVIGVHSAKFENEKETENIRKIIVRYGIEHPVVNDADFKIWEQYAVKAYPTQILIDPNGYIVGDFVGEGHTAEIDKAISDTVSEFRKKGQLNEEPLKFALERAKIGDLPLAFPGKVLADEKSNRLFIADSNHNRIVVTDLNGKLIDTIGSGKAALNDGNFQTASFKRPQGLALDGENLYVADTENHAIRLVNLQTKTVKTISGNGQQAAWQTSGGAAKTSELSSPWDLVKVGNALYIAMAGTHQIWKLDFDKQTVAPFAGTGAEARFDASISEAAFAQPSGIVSDGKKLWIADSESNIIREIDLQKETVETLVGGDLYEFGDVDGEEDDVRLQHPLGVALYDGKILLADTYNHKIKLLDANKKTVETFLGTGKSGQADGAKATFYEPGGLSIANGKLFVADTNNQAIRVVDLKTKQVSTLKIEGLTPPTSNANEIGESAAPNLKEIKTETREVSTNSNGSLVFNISLPEGFHLNKDAPNRYDVSIENGKNVKITNPAQKFSKIPLNVPFQTAGAGATELKAKLTVYYCREDNTGTCNIKTLSFRVPLKITASKKAAAKIEISANVEE